jgi:hypothetical protein
MYLKAALFLVAGVAASVALLLESPTPRTAFLLAMAVWSFCRLYYFLFYVLEKYIEPSFRFDGVLPALLFLWRRGRDTR